MNNISGNDRTMIIGGIIISAAAALRLGGNYHALTYWPGGDCY